MVPLTIGCLQETVETMAPFSPEAIHGQPISPGPTLALSLRRAFFDFVAEESGSVPAGSGGQDVLGHRGLPMAIPKWMIYTRKTEKNHDQLTMINYR